MRFGEIIRKAWHITWHYRWLWVLGVFAGITGGGGGGGGGGSSSNYRQSFGSGGGTGSSTPAMPDWNSIAPVVQHWVPFILIVILLLFLIGLAFAVISIGARGGLVWAVNEIEEGRAPRLGEAWNAGFARFWSVFGLGLLLQLPIVLGALLLVAIIFVPILGPLMRGDTPNPALVIAPVCGVLAIGAPVLLVAGVVLGVMYITGLRFVILHGMGTTHAAGEAWRALRARFGDHALMYVISLGLSVGASLVLVVPIVVVALGTMIPAGVAAASGNWTLFAGMTGIFILLILVFSLAYAAVWGTFTSAMWTIFFRRLTGREVLAPAPAAYPSVPPAPAAYPPAPPAPPASDAPPMYAPPPAPPTPPAPPAADASRE